MNICLALINKTALQNRGWQPTAPLAILQARAHLLETTRLFFKARGVLEVEVPILGQAPVTDPFLTALTTEVKAFPKQTFYLQTSPEYYQKRLIAAHSISCYFLGKCFRDDEYGRYHSPEFTMLEWYRLGFDDVMLMREVADLIDTLVRAVRSDQAKIQFVQLSYRETFQQFLHCDPHTAPLAFLQDQVQNRLGQIIGLATLNRDTALQLLLSEVIEPQFAKMPGPVFLYDFPASQAALAKLKILADGTEVAARFEVYWGGVELGNAYHELANATEQRQRFETNLRERQALNLPDVPVDQNLLEALEHGLPECAGIAMGFDRLVMVVLQQAELSAVQSFFAF